MPTVSLLVTVVASLSQGTAGAPHIISALRREALPQAAGSVGDAGYEDEDDKGRLEHE